MTKSRLSSKTKKNKNQFLKKDIWPQERDFILRPERLRYVRKMIKLEGCVFCSARDQYKKTDSLCVFKNKDAMVVLNKYPYNSGHVMVLPTRHCGDLSLLSDSEHIEVQKLLKKTVKIVQDIYKVDGMNIGLNMGSIAGAGLPDHLHWHVIPRWSGDTNFFPLIAETKVIPEALEQTFARYAEAFRGEH